VGTKSGALVSVTGQNNIVDGAGISVSVSGSTSVTISGSGNTVKLTQSGIILTTRQSATFYVTAAALGATITGGTGSNVLHVQDGGRMVMGNLITNVRAVYLDNGTNPYNFVANATANMTIHAGPASATITVGSASQTVSGTGSNLHVLASAANAGVAISNGSGGAILEITAGGTARLSDADTNLTVILDASTNLSLGKLSFITVVGAATGHNTITAGGQNQTLKSLGGNDTLIGSSNFGDTFLGTTSGLRNDTIRNFGGSDLIDITDLSFASVKPPSFNASSGSLQIGDGIRSVQLSMAGTYTSGSFALATDGHGGTLIAMSRH
jgi:hypothetical protein